MHSTTGNESVADWRESARSSCDEVEIGSRATRETSYRGGVSDATETLIERARGGDQAAIDALLTAHLPAIQAVVRLKAGPGLLARESVSDLAQSVCREVLASLESFRHGDADAFRGWLHTLAIRKLADRHRSAFAAQRDVRREVSMDDAPSAWGAACEAFKTPDHATPSHEAIGREAQARIDAAFGALDEEQQNVVLWSRFAGLPHSEIAALIGKSEAATRKILSRALLRIAAAVESH